MTGTGVAAHAAALRRDFDQAFAKAARVDATAREDLLAIRVGAQPYAIRLSEIAGLFAGKTITRVPGGAAALRGIAGFRGALLPVYDLSALLGHGGAEAPRWLVIAAAAPVALAFETFKGQLRVAPDDILPPAPRPDLPSHTRGVVQTKNFVGPILHLAAALGVLKANEPAASEEQ